MAEPPWAELERCQESYQAIFAALGFELKVEPVAMPGFISRSLAAKPARPASAWRCYGCALFDTQADEGRPLSRFTEWRVDKALLAKAHESIIR